MEAKKSHRDKKNGSAHEAWQRRKAVANAARGKQIYAGVGSRGAEYKRITT